MKNTRLSFLFFACSLLLLQGCKDQERQFLTSDVPAPNGTPDPMANTATALKINALDVEEVPNGAYKIISYTSWADDAAKAVGVVDASAQQTAFIEQRTYVENKGQEWTITNLGNGEYSIINVHSEKALDVPYGIPNPDTPLWQWSYSGNNAQRWIIEYQAYGVYRIKSKLDTSMGVHVENASTANGAKIRLESFVTSGPMQGAGYFFIVPVQYATTSATFIGLPDTQTYTEGTANRPYFTSQIDWILANKADISLVIQQGDITNRNIPDQWAFVEPEFNRLNNDVPYVLAVGNHDMGPNGDASNRNTTYFNQSFPYSTMSTLPAFGGVFEANKMDNAYYLLETGSYKWLILTLEFGPRDEVLTWANTIVNQYPDRTVILNTHVYMFSDDTRMGLGDTWNPHHYGIDDIGPTEVNDGEEIWTKLVKVNTNIRFVFSGHVLNDGCGTLVSTNDAGKPVYQFLANFQGGVTGSVNGGNGYLRHMTMDFVNEKLIVETFSSYPGVGDHPNPDHHFEVYPLEVVGL